MNDIEKVIKGLEYCIAQMHSCWDDKMECPYIEECRINCNQLKIDALELLKEQEEDIIAMSRFLESHGWDSDSICGKNVEIVVTNGDDDDA